MSNSIDEEDSNVNTTNSNDDVMLTTLDNPYSPFTQFTEWYEFDTAHNYNSLNYLARIVKDSHELSEVDQLLSLETGIDEIIDLNILGIYVKVTPSTFKDRSKEINTSTI